MIIKLTKTRAPHPCSYCRKRIPAGWNAMTKTSQGRGGVHNTIYFHQKCWEERERTGKDMSTEARSKLSREIAARKRR